MKKHRGTLLFVTGFIAALSAGWVAFPRAAYEQRNQPVQFSHRIHKDKAALKCDDCHTLRADGTFSGVPSLDKCAGCHASAMGNSAEEQRMIKQYIQPNRDIPWLIYARQPENVRFSHAFHVGLAKLPCERCHHAHGESDSLRPFEQDRVSGYSRDVAQHFEGMEMDDCMACHQQHGVKDSCLECHK